MTRKQFMESQGATCKNWEWSWSFINEAEKTIIFGSWDIYDKGNTTLILSEDWEFSKKGHKQRGYDESREHIRLIEEKGFTLKTFPMELTRNAKQDSSPAKITDFTPILTKKTNT